MCHRPGIAFPQGSIAPSARAGSDPESRINRRVSGLYIRRSEGGRSGGGSCPGCGPAFVPERVETTRWPWQTRAHSGDKSGAKSERRSSRVASSGPVEVAFLAVVGSVSRVARDCRTPADADRRREHLDVAEAGKPAAAGVVAVPVVHCPAVGEIRGGLEEVLGELHRVVQAVVVHVPHVDVELAGEPVSQSRRTM